MICITNVQIHLCLRRILPYSRGRLRSIGSNTSPNSIHINYFCYLCVLCVLCGKRFWLWLATLCSSVVGLVLAHHRAQRPGRIRPSRPDSERSGRLLPVSPTGNTGACVQDSSLPEDVQEWSAGWKFCPPASAFERVQTS